MTREQLKALEGKTVSAIGDSGMTKDVEVTGTLHKGKFGYEVIDSK